MPCCPGPRDCDDLDEGREGPSDADVDRFGGDEFACPRCGAEVYHDATQCHACGHAMTDASVFRRGRPRWVPIAAALAAAGTLLWFLVRLF